jgi:hypothetical protein
MPGAWPSAGEPVPAGTGRARAQHARADLQGNIDERDQLVAGTLDEHYESVQEFGEHWASLLAEQGPALAALIKDLHDFPDIAASLIKLFTERVNAIADSLIDVASRDDYIGHDVRAGTFAAIGAFGVAALTGEDTTEYIAKVTHMLFFGFTSEAGRRGSRHLHDIPPERHGLAGRRPNTARRRSSPAARRPDGHRTPGN